MKNRHLIVLIELLKGKYLDDYLLKSLLIKSASYLMLLNAFLILLDQESGLAPSLKGTLQRFEENEISQL